MKQGEEGDYVFQAWPAWAHGPNGESQIFDSEAEVPAGWTHPGGTKKAKSAPLPPAAPPPPPGGSEDNGQAATGDTDAAGVAFDPERHAATKTLTKSGLWRMKVGVSRPESESTPKALDL